MNIHQLSARYVEEQDRILMRIGTNDGTEMRLWLTRRLTLALWPTLNRAVIDHVARQDGRAAHLLDDATKKMLTDFQRDAVLQRADFSTPFQDTETPTNHPLGTAPLLVTEVKITPVASGPLKIAFNEKLPGQTSPRGFQMELAPPLVHGLVQLMERALGQAQWGFATEAVDGTPLLAQPTEDRPKYLN